MKKTILSVFTLVLVTLFQIGHTPAYGKVKLTPNIVFSGTEKDKMPYGQGTLTITKRRSSFGYGPFGVSQYVEEFGTITGFFTGEIITDAVVSITGTPEISGTIIYSLEYDKNQKTAVLKLRLTRGTINRIPFENLPVITYTQKNNDYPTCTVPTSTVSSPQLIEDSPIATTDYTIRNDNIVIVLKPKGYTLKNGYKITDTSILKGNSYREYTTITSPLGSEVSDVYNKPVPSSVVFRTKDGCEIVCTEAKKKYPDVPMVYSWIVSFPNKTKYTGTLSNIAGITPQELFSDNEIYRWVELMEGIEDCIASDIKFLDGSLLGMDGKTISYYNGISSKELETIKNSTPTSIKVARPGTLLSSISPEDLKNSQNLSIGGLLDETDLKVLTDLGKNLVRLDLSSAYIGLSEQAIQKRSAARLFGINTDLLLLATALGNEDKIDNALSEAELLDRRYLLPKETLRNLPMLEILILPKWCNVIEDDAVSSLPRLYEVKLPENLESIGNSFKDCPNLKEVTFPATLTDIGNAFSAKTLIKADFSACKNLKSIDGAMLKQGGTLYCPASLEFISSISSGYRGLQNVVIHCKSSKPFRGSVQNCTLYIPKGNVTAWYAEYGTDNIIKEY
ncbi:MAG: leucine-rich repeat domain-containing protein [Bacteroidales bacterium]|nr:leucine-rich repeat domain-containing protein [Bacteroidales bacterium]